MNWDEIEFFQSKTFRKILKVIQEDQKSGEIILPEKDNWFRAFIETPFEEVKVVILGQDPYPTREHPHGLAFSVRADVKPLPKSLGNIFRELNDDVKTVPDTGDLTRWATQGVLLLNTSLTVREGNPGSHSRIGWSYLTRNTIEALNQYREHIVFILWGKYAQTYEMYIDKSKHYVIKSPHPSPLSAHRGFFGSKPFSKTNTYLIKNKIEPIDW
jgi:uracil-DNA glycosylase